MYQVIDKGAYVGALRAGDLEPHHLCIAGVPLEGQAGDSDGPWGPLHLLTPARGLVEPLPLHLQIQPT